MTEKELKMLASLLKGEGMKKADTVKNDIR